MMNRMRTILCQLGAHCRPVTAAFHVSFVEMRCGWCGATWLEDWTDWQGLYLGGPRA